MTSKKKQREYDLANNLCCNPFRKRRCGRAEIETYIFCDGKNLPICKSCWKKISKEDWELKNGKITLRVVKDRKVFKDRKSNSKQRKNEK